MVLTFKVLICRVVRFPSFDTFKIVILIKQLWHCGAVTCGWWPSCFLTGHCKVFKMKTMNIVQTCVHYKINFGLYSQLRINRYNKMIRECPSSIFQPIFRHSIHSMGHLYISRCVSVCPVTWITHYIVSINLENRIWINSGL